MIFSLRYLLLILLLIFLNNSVYSAYFCKNISLETIQKFCSSGGLTTEQEVDAIMP